MSKETRRQRYNDGLKIRKANNRNLTHCKVLDLCQEKGYELVHLTEYHVRINGKLDVFPTSNKYHDLRKGTWGVLDNPNTTIEQEIINLLK